MKIAYHQVYKGICFYINIGLKGGLLLIRGGGFMSISDVIEQYLKQILQTKGQDVIEIKRNEIADQFQCVPSQINYVINTRFTVEKGYIVESKRDRKSTRLNSSH